MRRWTCRSRSPTSKRPRPPSGAPSSQTPTARLADAVGDHRRRGLAEVREPPVHRRRSRSGAPATSSLTLAGRRPATRRRRRVGRQPRAGRRLPRAPARDPGHDRDARRHAVHQGHATPRTTAREVVLAGDGFAGALAAEALRIARRHRRDARPAVRRPARSSPGQGTVGLEMLARGARRSTRSSCRSAAAASSPASRSRPRRCGPSIAVVGVQVEGYAGMLHALGRGPAPDRRPDDRRRHRRRPNRASSRARSSATLVDDIARRLRAAHRRRGRARRSRSRRRSSKAPARPGWPRCSSTRNASADRSVARRAQRRQHRPPRAVVGARCARWPVRAASSACAIEVPDRPGVLAAVAEIIGDAARQHRRRRRTAATSPASPSKRALLEVSVETRDRAHADEIVTALARRRHSRS